MQERGSHKGGTLVSREKNLLADSEVLSHLFLLVAWALVVGVRGVP
jgi:hypothetical protein